MIDCHGTKGSSLLFLLVALTSCGGKADIPHPAQTTWVQVGSDPAITIDRIDGFNLPAITYAVAAGTITIDRNFQDVIAWKEGVYLNLVAYSPLSTGASLIRIIPAQKRIVYFAAINGIGPIDHSQYHNDIDVYLNEDLVMIVGREGAGSHKEIRRIADGSLINVSQEYNAGFKMPDFMRIK